MAKYLSFIVMAMFFFSGEMEANEQSSNLGFGIGAGKFPSPPPGVTFGRACSKSQRSPHYRTAGGSVRLFVGGPNVHDNTITLGYAQSCLPSCGTAKNAYCRMSKLTPEACNKRWRLFSNKKECTTSVRAGNMNHAPLSLKAYDTRFCCLKLNIGSLPKGN